MKQDLPSTQEQLGALFGSFKAEWLREKMFDLFTKPAYWPEMVTERPCVLIGGRGTGKTTVLKCMSYEGQFVLSDRQPEAIPRWPYYGIYYRVNTNRVTAFHGPELPEERWTKVFAHYFNVTLCELVLRFLEWYQLRCPSSAELSEQDCLMTAESLHLAEARTSGELLASLRRSKGQFEAHINNIADGDGFPLSMQGAPIDCLLQGVSHLEQFAGKSVFFLLDEYENFLPYQQKVVNTLIKHSEGPYTFKVGVRELGWRIRSTVGDREQLIHPADYVQVKIGERLQGEAFSSFALDVCNSRLREVRTPSGCLESITETLPALAAEDEAEILDAQGEGVVSAAERDLRAALGPPAMCMLDQMSLLEKYFLVFWARSKQESMEAAWGDYQTHAEEYRVRYGNYKHALLYTIRRGKRGIQKHYAGSDTYIQMSAGNIRYFLELVEQSLLLHIRKGEDLPGRVSAETQTVSAQNVGKKYLEELEGLCVHGADLKRLVLGLGRVYQTMAAQLEGHTPEVNQFHLKEDPLMSDEIQRDVEELLRSAVMHLALIRFPGSKASSEGDTKDYDFMMHPIYSAFFVFSHRRKRRLRISGDQLLGLVRTPRKTIPQVLREQHREPDERLPEQLLLFQPYYGEHQ